MGQARHGSATTTHTVTGAVLGAVAIVVAAQVAFPYLPLMHTIFGSVLLSLADGVLVIAVSAVSLLVLEIEKHLLRDWFGEN